MKSFFWRIVICVTPVLLACWVTYDAWVNNNFKLGVDLSGGTILIYEMDIRKGEDTGKKSKKKDEEKTAASYFKEKAGELAEALKRRIDPTATYNIIIRPAGTEGRVEIILPTGGGQETAKAEEAWQSMLKKLSKEYNVADLSAPRGNREDVVDRIQSTLFWKNWQEKLFDNEKVWKSLLTKIEERWNQLKLPADPKNKEVTKIDLLAKVPVGKVKELSQEMAKLLQDQTPQVIDSWIKQKAWEELIDQIVAMPELQKSIEKRMKSELKDKTEAEKTKILNAEFDRLKADLKTIPPDRFEELVGRVESNGNVIVQATLETVAPLLGQDTGDDLFPRKELTEFISNHYGPSGKEIRSKIDDAYKEVAGESKDLTVEKVQEIKDLVSKVGSLEFRILANEVDDKQGIEAAKELINNASNKGVADELEQAAIDGQPPPAPRNPDGTLKEFNITLANGDKVKATYSWIELGKQVRKELGLNNDAKFDSKEWKKAVWLQLNAKAGKATQITEPGASTKKDKWLGALFYRRDCKDRNLPDSDRRDKKYEYFVLTRNPIVDETGKFVDEGEPMRITGDYLRNATTDITSGIPRVSFSFDAKGALLFGELTGSNVPRGSGSEAAKAKRHLSIILDGLVMSAPTINSKITSSGQITGNFSRKEVDSLVNILRSGALPATLKPQPVSESTIGALLGADTINSGVTAVGWAFVAVLVFMILYYHFSGIVACIALFANLILTVGFMVAVQATFTLPGLAGLVLMLGMAVDANVLIYERLREERDRGANLALALRNGYERAFPTIIDTHLTSIFTAIVLYAMGNDQLKGFAISLTVGLIISLFTSLYMTRTVFDLALSKGWVKNLSMFRILSNPNINFMSVRYLVFSISVFITIAGMTLFLARTPKDLNIDFKGGTAFSAQLRLDEKYKTVDGKEIAEVVENKAMNVSELRKLFTDERQKELLAVKSVEEVAESDGREYKIVFADGEVYPSVNFANRPVGSTPEEREENVKERASSLPDWSLEMLFPGFATNEPMKEPDESRFFTVRTSEMERELVQTVLDRLLREKTDGKTETLLRKVEMKVNDSGLEDGTRVAKLTFSDYASPIYIKTLLSKEIRREFPIDEINKSAFRFEIIGEGKSKEGRFKELTVRFDDLKDRQVPQVKEALRLAEVAFNQRPQPERLENFDSELAAETRLSAIGAIFASWLAVVLYLWFRFGSWTFGLAAVCCLVHDLCFTLGLIAASYYVQGTVFGNMLMIEDFKIDLTGVAALLTLVGYSVADTIVVFDRVREVRGKNPDLTPKIINDSVNQTLSRTLLTSGTTAVVVLVLYFFGGPGIHLFAFIMVAGIFIGTFSSIYIASPLLLIFGEGKHTDPKVKISKEVHAAEARA